MHCSRALAYLEGGHGACDQAPLLGFTASDSPSERSAMRGVDYQMIEADFESRTWCSHASPLGMQSDHD